MDKQEEIDKAYARFRAAGDRVKQCPVVAQGGRGIEVAYSEAYQVLVRLGVEPQLKGKYR
jgi:hypothetical protein